MLFVFLFLESIQSVYLIDIRINNQQHIIYKYSLILAYVEDILVELYHFKPVSKRLYSQINQTVLDYVSDNLVFGRTIFQIWLIGLIIIYYICLIGLINWYCHLIGLIIIYYFHLSLLNAMNYNLFYYFTSIQS